MSRLTKKELMSAINQPMCFGSRLVGKKMFAQIIKELCEYKDIEEELGVDLVTLFKALKDGIWLKDKKDQYMPYHCLLRDDFILVLYEDIYNEEYLLEDYGKTWALTEEELL